MGMTMSQKILAAHAGLDEVLAGQLIEANIDLVHGNDITAPLAIREMKKLRKKTVFDRDKVVLVMDHFVPNKDIVSAKCTQICRNFAAEQELSHYFDVGNMGIEHALIPEQGLITAGELSVGADSHTCTYGALGAFSTGVGSTDMAAAMATGRLWFKVPAAIRVRLEGKLSPHVSGKDLILHLIGEIGVDGARYESLEFCGEGVSSLSMDDRFTICNMAIEAGAKNGIFPVDEKTLRYIREHGNRSFRSFEADPDARYEREILLDLSKLKPTVAFPHLPENTKEIGSFPPISIDQVVIGSCTNGRIEDFRAFASLVKGKRKAPGVTAWLVPGSWMVDAQIRREGLDKIFTDAGFELRQPGCSACLAMNDDKIPSGKYAISTSNRNFEGRQGPGARTLLAGPLVAAAAAVTGVVTDPRSMMG